MLMFYVNYGSTKLKNDTYLATAFVMNNIFFSFTSICETRAADLLAHKLG